MAVPNGYFVMNLQKGFKSLNAWIWPLLYLDFVIVYWRQIYNEINDRHRPTSSLLFGTQVIHNSEFVWKMLEIH